MTTRMHRMLLQLILCLKLVTEIQVGHICLTTPPPLQIMLISDNPADNKLHIQIMSCGTFLNEYVDFQEETISYIAGYVIKMAVKKIGCVEFCQSIK